MGADLTSTRHDNDDGEKTLVTHTKVACASTLLLADACSKDIGEPRCRDNAYYHRNATPSNLGVLSNEV